MFLFVGQITFDASVALKNFWQGYPAGEAYTGIAMFNRQ
jgi:hypothetical protein